MGLAERFFDALRSSLEMRGDVDRMSETVKALEDDVSDHEKRLIRIETLIEVGQNRSRHSLPGASD